MRPVDAATLIIVRNGAEVLLGARHASHAFLPKKYVFPGGRVDPGDARVPCPIGLNLCSESRLLRTSTQARARALAMSAVRETFEETGLILGSPHAPPITTRSPGWKPFFSTGFAPALDKLEFVATAVTPPGNTRRFLARFFLVDAVHLTGSLSGNGELEDLHWAPLDEATELPLAKITQLVLHLLQADAGILRGGLGKLPLYRALLGRELLEHHIGR